MLRWLVATTLLVSATAWMSSLPTSTITSRGTRSSRGDVLWASVKKPKKAPAAGGFGSKPVEAKETKVKGIGVGVKALVGQYGIYKELKEAGAQIYEAHVRGLLAEGETPGEWRLVGYVAAENNDAAAALQLQQQLIFEHSEVVFPGFKLMRSKGFGLEAGWRKYEEPADGSEAAATGDVTPFERKAIPVGSVKVGYQNLVPIKKEAAKAGVSKK